MSAGDDPVQLVGSLMAGFIDSRCLHVVANLGMADAVGDEPVPVAELAAELGLGEGGEEVTELEGFGPSFADELEELAQEIETSDGEAE